jgi:ribonuclease D
MCSHARCPLHWRRPRSDRRLLLSCLRLTGAPTSIAPVSSSPEAAPSLIQKAADVAQACARARAAGVVAVDTEADSLHSYFHKVCLIQISFGGESAVLDPLALSRDDLGPFVELLADEGVEKVLHGADYDLRVLDRDLGARVRRLRDTQVAAQLLGEEQTGLAALVEREVGVSLNKKFQRADWGERPLPSELLAYAAGDTAHLELLRQRFGERLETLGRLAWWEEECVALEAVRWETPPPNPLAFERIKGAGKLGGEARDRLAALHAWREKEAAAADVPPFRILRKETVLALAAGPPPDLEALATMPGVGKTTVRRHGREILRLLASPPPAPPRAVREFAERDRERERRIKQARATRDHVATALRLAPGLLAPRTALELVVDRRPRDERGLFECLARHWRTSVMAPVLLPLVAGWEGGMTSGDADPA